VGATECALDPAELREGGQGRPEAARRGSLEGPGVVFAMMDGEARQGFVVASPGVGDACAVVSMSSGVRVKQATLGCLDMSSPGPVAGSEHGAIRRSQQCSIT
jgi:hypothetical protein